jgi:hypothetical protein
MRFKLSTFVLISLVITVAVGSLARSYFNRMAALEQAKSTNSLVKEMVDSFATTGLGSIADVQRVVDHAASTERSVMFIDICWSTTSKIGSYRFAEFIVEYQNAHPNDPVMFYYVDCSHGANGYAPFRSLPGWKDLETDGQSLICGNGELVWMHQGEVLRVEPIGRTQTNSELIRMTDRLWLLGRDNRR